MEEENKELKNKLLLAAKSMDSLKIKLDLILKKNDEITESTIAKHNKESDAMLEQLKNAKNLSKKNYWTMALQLKCKNMMAGKMKKLGLDKI